MTATTSPLLELDSAGDVLSYARTRRAEAQAAEADVFAAAATWAELHPAESIHHAAAWAESSFGEASLVLAGPGAPLVAEFCVAELGAALGMSTDAARALIADAVETKHRLPKLNARVVAGTLPVWRARRIAQTTMGLTAEAAQYVDAQVAPFAHKVGPVVTDRLVAEATARFMPTKAREDADRAAEGRHVRFHHGYVSFNGTTVLEAELDLADALDLDAALSRGAEDLKAAGCNQSLDVRRAMAVGEIARRQLALDLQPEGVSTGSTDEARDSTDRPATAARQVVLYVHLSDAALRGTHDTDCADEVHLARVEKHRQVVTAEQVRDWCANPDSTITVKPVIDLHDHLSVSAYEIPDRIREHVELRDHTCVFPWCTRPARRSDIDHVIPHTRGGPTATDNLAALCRRHHRLKTHSTWNYTVIDEGTFLWSSPHGYQYLRDHTGTYDTSR